MKKDSEPTGYSGREKEREPNAPPGKEGLTPERIKEVVREVLNEVSSGSQSGTAAKKTRSAAKEPHGIVAIGSDHGGFKLKESLKRYLEEELTIIVKDFGTHSEESVDYPDFALAVARAVASGECESGIVIDTMGIGSSIAANKVRGIRAALCHDVSTATNSRAHNDANVLALGSRVVVAGNARRIVREWLSTSFEGGRHAQRVQKIVDAECG